LKIIRLVAKFNDFLYYSILNDYTIGYTAVLYRYYTNTYIHKYKSIQTGSEFIYKNVKNQIKTLFENFTE
jgi:hypothetical protein